MYKGQCLSEFDSVEIDENKLSITLFLATAELLNECADIFKNVYGVYIKSMTIQRPSASIRIMFRQEHKVIFEDEAKILKPGFIGKGGGHYCGTNRTFDMPPFTQPVLTNPASNYTGYADYTRPYLMAVKQEYDPPDMDIFWMVVMIFLSFFATAYVLVFAIFHRCTYRVGNIAPIPPPLPTPPPTPKKKKRKKKKGKKKKGKKGKGKKGKGTKSKKGKGKTGKVKTG